MMECVAVGHAKIVNVIPRRNVLWLKNYSEKWKNETVLQTFSVVVMTGCVAAEHAKMVNVIHRRNVLFSKNGLRNEIMYDVPIGYRLQVEDENCSEWRHKVF
ncbi:uncharacterized protein LOC114535122 [Dendronephthya gigantea]|uniref:uncharacterized protein LOC114529976 n=1 Tax=Dendronephthya gigantea TaxID=151771 RepID=UPI00106D4C6D|nr:uncharacterized protein LOC114529976 [Dendronephthya gigantea]XP_028412300.1 uncharacterized protein LOC114535122 [Dendronephthya gigantea]